MLAVMIHSFSTGFACSAPDVMVFYFLVGATNVRTIDMIPPPAPASAWATLSFCGMTGLEAMVAVDGGE